MLIWALRSSKIILYIKYVPDLMKKIIFCIVTIVVLKSSKHYNFNILFRQSAFDNESKCVFVDRIICYWHAIGCLFGVLSTGALMTYLRPWVYSLFEPGGCKSDLFRAGSPALYFSSSDRFARQCGYQFCVLISLKSTNYNYTN